MNRSPVLTLIDAELHQGETLKEKHAFCIQSTKNKVKIVSYYNLLNPFSE